MDSENEQTLHGPGSVAGLGMEPTIQAGVSATLNQPQGKNLALPNSNDGNIRTLIQATFILWLTNQEQNCRDSFCQNSKVMLRNGKTSGTVSTVPFTQTRS